MNYQACAAVARDIGLGEALRLSPSATKIGARDSDAVLGDACEALIGLTLVILLVFPGLSLWLPSMMD